MSETDVADTSFIHKFTTWFPLKWSQSHKQHKYNYPNAHQVLTDTPIRLPLTLLLEIV